MHVITKKRLDEFAKKHPESKNALQIWYRIIKNNNFKSFAELKMYFSSSDMVKNLTVFNIGGNKVRLIASIHFNRGKVYSGYINSFRI